MEDSKIDLAPADAPLPELTLKNVIADIKFGVVSLFNNPDFSRVSAVLVVLFEMLALKFIIGKVPYTEIDYSTYMQQIEQIERGELNYSKIAGDTGPIVYPGGFVYFYAWMKWFTNGVEDIATGQTVFRYLYLATLVMTLVVYFTANGKIKPYVLYLLVASKRLHSIYVLRLFNDCFTTFFMVATVLVLQQAARLKRTRNPLSSVLTYFSADLFSVAVSVKMNALLYLPGYLVVVYFLSDENLFKTAGVVLFGLFVQLGMNWQFLADSPAVRSAFLSGAYDFKRSFMYKWTVNWRFLGEHVFLSREFHTLLLAGHLLVLLVFVFARWMSPANTGKPVGVLLRDSLLAWKSTISPQNVVLGARGGQYVFETMAVSNLVGVLFARTLHYQFLSWYQWSLPLLLAGTGLPGAVCCVVAAVHEWCWNVYPATNGSSAVLVGVLGVVVGGNLLKKPVEAAVVVKKKE